MLLRHRCIPATVAECRGIPAIWHAPKQVRRLDRRPQISENKKRTNSRVIPLLVSALTSNLVAPAARVSTPRLPLEPGGMGRLRKQCCVSCRCVACRCVRAPGPPVRLVKGEASGVCCVHVRVGKSCGVPSSGRSAEEFPICTSAAVRVQSAYRNLGLAPTAGMEPPPFRPYFFAPAPLALAPRFRLAPEGFPTRPSSL